MSRYPADEFAAENMPEWMLDPALDPPSPSGAWVPINFSNWPEPSMGVWAMTEAAFEQQYGEQRIRHAQDAEDAAADGLDV